MVNRDRELDQLRRLARDPPALVVLRGRRRVGKTFLLRAAFPGNQVVSLQAEERPKTLQLEAFARECSRLVPGAPPLAFGEWDDAFRFLERQASTSGTIVVILDEFQHLVRSDPGLVSTVQRFWDRWDADAIPLMVVLSGSALSFMAGLLGASKPTYGRSVYRPLLLPLTYLDCAAFAPADADAAQRIERFAVLGGTPQYQRWAGPVPIDEIVARTILPPDAPLHDEPTHLIREEEGIRDPGPYFGSLQAIADGYSTTSAIAARLEIKQQLAVKFLSRLEELGYVARVEPVTPEGKDTARGFWRIVDPYFRFWFRYVFPNRSRLARGRIHEVAVEIEKDLSTFIGPVFEECCREWLARYSSLGRGALTVGSWWSRKHDTEIDLVAVDKKGYMLLGSCKWSTRLVTEKVLDDLNRARALLGPKARRAQLALFSRKGFTESVRKRAEEEEVALVEVGDLFSEERPSIRRVSRGRRRTPRR